MAGARSDFLEKNNVGKLRSLQDVIEDELGVPERATGLTGRPGYSKM